MEPKKKVPHMIHESIFAASARTFFKALFGVLGVCIGFLLLLILVGSLSSTSLSEPEPSYSAQVAPNAEGIRKVLSKKAPVILKINVNGAIGTELLNESSIRKQLLESREGLFKNNRVKALLIHIQSPGGTVTDSDGIYRALKAYKEKYNIPIYAYVDGLCASGGMYIACAADKVFASNVSLIGSVGVLFPPFLNFSELMTKLGVGSLTVTAGKDKDAMNPLRPWRAGEQDNIKSITETFYKQFVDIVASNRPNINKEELIETYGAQIFPAEKAKEIGMIDDADANVFTTIKELKEKIGIEDDYYQVVEFEKKNWVTQLVNSQSPLFTGKIQHSIDGFEEHFMNQFLYLYRPGQ